MRFVFFKTIMASVLFSSSIFPAIELPKDPFLWLEDSESNATQEWLKDQAQAFNTYISGNPHRSEMKRMLEKFISLESYASPLKCGERFFFICKRRGEDQFSLEVQNGINLPSERILDPAKMGKKAPLAIADYVPSSDGKFLAYGISENGSDWVTWKVLNLTTGEHLNDTLEKIKFISITWAPDSVGFYYTRLDSDDLYRVYYHKLENAQDQDERIFEYPLSSNFFIRPFLSSDKRFLMLDLSEGSSGKNGILFRDLENSDGLFQTLIPQEEGRVSFISNKGTKFYFWTDHEAPFGKIIEIDLDQSEKKKKDIVVERPYPFKSVVQINEGFLALFSENVSNQLILFDHSGNPIKEIALPDMGCAQIFGEEKDSGEVFVSFTHFTHPPTLYRYLSKTRELQIFKEPKIPFNPEDYEIQQEFYSSKDGTQIPMYLIYKKGMELNGESPTLLYGYGGFGIKLEPFYSAFHMAWIEKGGIFAVANIRGGSEYGNEWHEKGKGKNKQNCFDDFIAGAQHLIARGYTNSSKLACRGMSNGGLLVAACINQHPELFKAAVVGVGVLDMLRFPLFTGGRFWISEYGNPQNPEDFEVLRQYSPYHNIQKGDSYPSILVTTADHDDRVVPLHSYKYLARLQKKQKGERKILLRVEAGAGHGEGKPQSKWIEESADILCFLIDYL